MASSTRVTHAREHTYRLVRELVHEFAARVVAVVEADVQARIRAGVFGKGPRPPVKRPARASRRAPGSAEAAIGRVKELIENGYADRVSLDVLAGQMGFSKFHLARRFSRVVGQSPIQYRNRIRLERAQALLGQGMRPVQVARRAGFADQAHMTREFRARLGRTPGEVRRAK